tara:strand:+ start:656 stop:1234 length:579 start_codon:yes stop_codon:yes gene_type:complete
MKLKNLIKIIPFLSTLFLVTLLTISNQKVNTKLKILLWNTPSLSLGTYIAISTGTGFLISYVLTTNLSNLIKSKSNTLNYKNFNNNKDNYEYLEIDNNANNDKIDQDNISVSRDRTLIERDIKDPSPTINASFRVIGKIGRSDFDYACNNDVKYNNSNQYDGSYYEQEVENDAISQDKDNSTDWNDESFSTW